MAPAQQRHDPYKVFKFRVEIDGLTVAAFSDAYFAVMQALPELVKPAALEPTVLVAGRRVSIKIGAQGKSILSEDELDALVRDFRS